jgi:hypothetical protein
MSRRQDEFKHRTSVFEGAYRAWSHLGGLDPVELQSKSAQELDPTIYTRELDSRRTPSQSTLTSGTSSVATAGSSSNGSGGEYPYERLPSLGIEHPYVRAILALWLGAQSDDEAAKVGLATLRVWWQHRSKGLNKTAVKLLEDSDFQSIVDHYTSHFFELIHNLVMHDNVQVPRSLQTKLRHAERLRNLNRLQNVPTADSKQHDCSRSKLVREGVASMGAAAPLVSMHFKGKGVPGKIDLDLPCTVEPPSCPASSKLTLHGTSQSTSPWLTQQRRDSDRSSVCSSITDSKQPCDWERGDDPTTTPVVFRTMTTGHTLILLEVEGINCPYSVESVLRGCRPHENPSPIAGLLDAVAHQDLSSVILRIDDAGMTAADRSATAKRVAYEASHNLAMVGYIAQAKQVELVPSPFEAPGFHYIRDTLPSRASPLQALQESVATYAATYPFDFFDFTKSCSCRTSGECRQNCPR